MAESIRALIDLAVVTPAEDEHLRAAALEIDEIATRLGGPSHDIPEDHYHETAAGNRLYNPVVGRANPLAPYMTLSLSGARTAVGEVRLKAVHEGPRGAVHGGWVAALLDQILGYVVAQSVGPALTAELRVRYRRPTPYGAQLRLKARIVEERARSIRATSEIYLDHVITAEAEGVLVRARPAL